MLVVDGAEGKVYNWVSYPQFSPDSQHVLCKAGRQDTSFVVVDGVEGPAFYIVDLIRFSPDSKRVAYGAQPKPGKHFASILMLDGKPGKSYDKIEFSAFGMFSPDSKHVVYVAEAGKQKYVVADDKESPTYDRINWNPHFSPDGKHMAYVASRGGKIFVVLDGVEGKEYAYVNRPVFSPDSQRLAYAASKGRAWTVVLDGKEGLQHRLGEAWRTQVFFSPDSRRMAYRASQGRAVEFVVVDGVQSKRYQLVEPGCPVFSPDSKHMAYWAAAASGGWRIFVNGSYTNGYDEPLHGSSLAFDGPDSLRALAIRNGEILRVEIRIPSP